VLLCEGYTDVIALHQAGMRNAVGLMGTALTAEQVGELSRMAQTVLLALDADTAGQEAMLRASTLAAKRKLELRVVPLPAGADPAELVQREGPEALAAAVGRAVPFVRFRVERELESGDVRSPEGRDRILDALRPVFATLPQSAMRLELMRAVSSRLALPESLAEQLLSEPGRRAGPPSPERGAGAQRRGRAGADGGRPARPGARREDPERAFLALCIASPEEGAQALRGLDVEREFSSDVLVRAARRLREGDLSAPMADRPGEPALGEDPELLALLAELVVQAAGEEPNPGMLEVQRLQLELASLERGIQQERGREHADVSALARRKAEKKVEFDRAYARVLDETGTRER
jgi:DNA primase